MHRRKITATLDTPQACFLKHTTAGLSSLDISNAAVSSWELDFLVNMHTHATIVFVVLISVLPASDIPCYNADAEGHCNNLLSRSARVYEEPGSTKHDLHRRYLYRCSPLSDHNADITSSNCASNSHGKLIVTPLMTCSPDNSHMFKVLLATRSL